jgi:hypothetical protein
VALLSFVREALRLFKENTVLGDAVFSHGSILEA